MSKTQPERLETNTVFNVPSKTQPVWIMSDTNRNKLTAGIYTAIMVEPRIHSAYSTVLNCFLKKLSIEWNFVLFVGNKNREYVESLLNSAQFNAHKSRVTIVPLGVDDLSLKDYTELFIHPNKLYDHIPTEVFLVFQCDTWICVSDPSDINRFLQYDYIGAPWPHHNNMVGNGGLSLRKKSKMLRIIREVPFYEHSTLTNGPTPEDIYFACGCLQLGLNVPNWTVADQFSNENRICPYSWGVHKPWIGGGLHLFIDRSRYLPDIIDFLVANDIISVESRNP